MVIQKALLNTHRLHIPQKGSYPPGNSGCPCPTYPPMDRNQNSASYSSNYYPTPSSCSCYSSTSYYSSQPPSYTSSSYSSPKVNYPPKTTPTPYKPLSEPNTPSSTMRATYDTAYDNKSGSLNSVACSNGANGLMARFPTFGDIPSSLSSGVLSTSCGTPLTAARAGI